MPGRYCAKMSKVYARLRKIGNDDLGLDYCNRNACGPNRIHRRVIVKNKLFT